MITLRLSMSALALLLASVPASRLAAELFARGQLKLVTWSQSEIERRTVKRYRPGAQP